MTRHSLQTGEFRLLNKIKNGDETSWEEFYKLYTPLIFLRGGDLRLTQSEKEELVQNVMLAFFKCSKTFVYDKSKGRFRDYFKTIIRNQAYDIMRKRDNNTISSDENESLINSLEVDDSHWNEEWQKLILTQSFEELKHSISPLVYQVFAMLSLDKLSPKEVVETLDITTNAVYVYKHQALNKLQKIVKEIDS